jgi:DNA polymerase III subunit alpha
MIKIIRECTQEDLENWIYTIDDKDSNLYKEANNPNKIGIFQLNGNTAKRLCDEIKPENFNEVMAINAMARPGPLETCAPFYVERKESGISPYPKEVEEILEESHYTFLYQEQIIETFHKIGGFTLDEADLVRGIMKKLSKAEKAEEDVAAWNKVIKKFVRGASKLGIDESMAIQISQDLQAFSGYSFNKAHASSYSYIALITLYLSHYFREYFYSATLAYEADKGDNFTDKINSVRKQGTEILPPDINKSDYHFKPEGIGKIRFGLNDIKFVGDKAVENILNKREDGDFSSFIDFYSRTKDRSMTIKVIEALVSVGCFEFEEPNRKKHLKIIKDFWENKKSTKVREKMEAIYQQSKKEVETLPGIVQDILEVTIDNKVAYEKAFYGANIFSSMFTDKVLQAIDKLNSANVIYPTFDVVKERSLKIPVVVNSIRSFNDKNGKEMAFLNIEDQSGKEMSVPVFQSYWKFVKEKIITDKLYLMNVFKSDEGGILFGTSEWVKGEFKIMRMVRRIGG